MSSEKMICFTDSRGNRFFLCRTVLFYAWSMTMGNSPALSAAITVRNRWEIDGKCRNIRQFAKQMEKNGIRYRPMNETNGKESERMARYNAMEETFTEVRGVRKTGPFP